MHQAEIQEKRLNWVPTKKFAKSAQIGHPKRFIVLEAENDSEEDGREKKTDRKTQHNDAGCKPCRWISTILPVRNERAEISARSLLGRAFMHGPSIHTTYIDIRDHKRACLLLPEWPQSSLWHTACQPYWPWLGNLQRFHRSWVSLCRRRPLSRI